MDGVESKPPAVRVAIYSAPTGMVLLILATFLAASNWVCKEECVRRGDDREDMILQCMEQCEVSTTVAKDTTCESQCQKQVGYTRRQVRKRQAECVEDCGKHPIVMRFSALLGILALLVVAPLLGTYRGSCRCECCTGQGCSARLALLNISWVSYGLSCLWALPSIVEESSEVGAKVLFGLLQGISMAAMAASRRLAEEEEARGGHAVGEPARVVGATGGSAHQMNVIGSMSKSGPSNEELQTQIQQLQQQVRDLVQLQTLQVQAAAAAAAATAVATPPVAVPSTVSPPAVATAQPQPQLLKGAEQADPRRGRHPALPPSWSDGHAGWLASKPPEGGPPRPYDSLRALRRDEGGALCGR
eukprot:CAMPEP_0179143914 /NCGR_PEP_ID=MMETSP0796-20121207/69265_1 /TAXON_ID=73915 /ORGANISM="Pyrodinium bahamense, Strain pbaha01" /LENGTH=358 /DNA_ID=CAMNT_0020844019 /DNA_START=14 /DNA_END=1091 /DNA_ORIENTATION=+